MYTVLLQLLCAVDNNTCFLVTQSVAFFQRKKGKENTSLGNNNQPPSSCDPRVAVYT